MKIAIFCPNWVGDLVMATPALRAVRAQFPEAEISAIVRPYVGPVLAGLKLVDQILWHQPHGPRSQDRGWRLAKRLRREEFDLAVVLPNSFRSGLWSWLCGAPRRVGIDRNGRGWLLTDPLAPPPRHEPRPIIDEYLRIAAYLGCQQLSRKMELAVTAADEHQLQEFWNRQPVKGRWVAAGVVCLNPGGAFGAAKHWPVESFAELARLFVGEMGKRVLVLCGPAERDTARQIVAAARHPAVFSLADEQLSLGLTKAAVRHSELLVTTDSGPRHFAAPFQVPVVTLFGPTHINWSETFYERSVHLQLDVECGPCQQRTCPLAHHQCMQRLRPAFVFRRSFDLMQRFSPEKSAA